MVKVWARIKERGVEQWSSSALLQHFTQVTYIKFKSYFYPKHHMIWISLRAKVHVLRVVDSLWGCVWLSPSHNSVNSAALLVTSLCCSQRNRDSPTCKIWRQLDPSVLTLFSHTFAWLIHYISFRFGARCYFLNGLILNGLFKTICHAPSLIVLPTAHHSHNPRFKDVIQLTYALSVFSIRTKALWGQDFCLFIFCLTKYPEHSSYVVGTE